MRQILIFFGYVAPYLLHVIFSGIGRKLQFMIQTENGDAIRHAINAVHNELPQTANLLHNSPEFRKPVIKGFAIIDKLPVFNFGFKQWFFFVKFGNFTVHLIKRHFLGTPAPERV